MNEIKVKLLKTILILMISGALAYVVYKSFSLFFQSIDDIYGAIKAVKLVVNCL